MKQELNIPEGLERILKKLCEAVGADYDSIDFTEKDWYLKHQWSVAEEKQFRESLIKDIKQNEKIYSGFIDTKAPKKKLENAINMFLVTYGWSYNDVEFKV